MTLLGFPSSFTPIPVLRICLLLFAKYNQQHNIAFCSCNCFMLWTPCRHCVVMAQNDIFHGSALHRYRNHERHNIVFLRVGWYPCTASTRVISLVNSFWASLYIKNQFSINVPDTLAPLTNISLYISLAKDLATCSRDEDLVRRINQESFTLAPWCYIEIRSWSTNRCLRSSVARNKFALFITTAAHGRLIFITSIINMIDFSCDVIKTLAAFGKPLRYVLWSQGMLVPVPT